MDILGTAKIFSDKKNIFSGILVPIDIIFPMIIHEKLFSQKMF